MSRGGINLLKKIEIQSIINKRRLCLFDIPVTGYQHLGENSIVFMEALFAVIDLLQTCELINCHFGKVHFTFLFPPFSFRFTSLSLGIIFPFVSTISIYVTGMA